MTMSNVINLDISVFLPFFSLINAIIFHSAGSEEKITKIEVERYSDLKQVLEGLERSNSSLEHKPIS